MKYKNTTYTIHEYDCDQNAIEFMVWLKKNHPKIKRDFWPQLTGIGGGLHDENRELVENDLWDSFCGFLAVSHCKWQQERDGENLERIYQMDCIQKIKKMRGQDENIKQIVSANSG